MKKISLKKLPANEVLSKRELRKIVGGNGSNQWPETYIVPV